MNKYSGTDDNIDNNANDNNASVSDNNIGNGSNLSASNGNISNVNASQIGDKMIKEYQQRIDDIQALYRQFEQNKTALAKSQALWQQTAQIAKTLQDFYDKEFSPIYDAIEQGVPLDLLSVINDETYSIMAEDTLWNGFYDYQQLLWWQMKFALAELEPK